MFDKLFNKSYFTLFLVVVLVIGFLVPVEDDDTGTSTRYSGSSSVMSTPQSSSSSRINYYEMAIEHAKRQEAIQAAMNTPHVSPSASPVIQSTLTTPSGLKYPAMTEEDRAKIAASRTWTLKETPLKVNSQNESEPETGGKPEVTSTPDVDVPEVDDPEI